MAQTPINYLRSADARSLSTNVFDPGEKEDILRYDTLTENSTRYDYLAAAPDDEVLVAYWYTWAVFTFLVGMLALIVFFGIVTCKSARGRPFNLYIVYLTIPDFIFSLNCSITCLMSAIKGSYWSDWMCYWQQFYVVFGIGANAWLNGIVAYQLHTMLKNSHIRKRYIVPTRLQVTKHAMIAYLWCIFLGTWGLYNSPSFPYQVGLADGMACLPLEVDTASTLFFWLVFFHIFAGIPIVYVTYVCWDVWRRKLLPPSGKGRLLSIYFGRIVVVFILMWIPAVFLIFAVSHVPPWVSFVGGTWSHLQGGVSAGLALLKPDIRSAVVRFLTCKCCQDETEEMNAREFGLRIATNSSQLRETAGSNQLREIVGYGELQETMEESEVAGELSELQEIADEEESSELQVTGVKS